MKNKLVMKCLSFPEITIEKTFESRPILKTTQLAHQESKKKSKHKDGTFARYKSIVMMFRIEIWERLTNTSSQKKR